MEYLSQIITEKELSNIAAGKFNILEAPRGIGKTTFMFDDRILSFARSNKNIIYLIHNKVTRDTIAANHSEVATVWDESEERWLLHRQGGYSWCGEKDSQKIQVMCYQTFSAIIRNEGPQFLQDIDLIVWDEFDDIRKYLMQEVKDLKKKLPAYSNEKILALLEDGNPKSVASFVYKIKTLILDPAKTVLLAVSATPQLAATIFADYVNYILEGKIENIFDAKQTFYIESVAAALKNKMISPNEGRKFWCYTTFITDILRIEELAKQCGFTVLSLWAKDNEKYKYLWTADKDAAFKMIKEEGKLPAFYDFIIVNDVVGRSIDILDTTFQDWICNSSVYEDVGQFIRARFQPERKFLLNAAFTLKQEGFPAIYYEWHSVKELRFLLAENPILDENHKPYKTWNAFVKKNPEKIEKRKYGRQQDIQYRIR